MRFVSRLEWGARFPTKVLIPLRPERVKGVVVHHSGVEDGPDGLDAVRSFERYHMDTRGWDAVGYNWLVDRRGGIFEGRGPFRGAATRGWNSRSESVCYTGWGFQEVPTVALSAINTVIADIQARYGHGLWVKGHRDLSSSTCPGDWLYGWLTDGAEVDGGAPSEIDWAAILAYLRGLEAQVRAEPLSRLRRSRGEAVRVAQRHLKHRGYDPGPVDGIYGRRTAGAVKRFEGDMGFLKPNGVLDSDTWTALFVM